jgi:hypothetical protein
VTRQATDPGPIPTQVLHPSRRTPDANDHALNVLLLIFIFNFTLQPLTEPDFGWHLRTGLDLLARGWTLPSTDPYSHTMPDWRWVEHAWLTDVMVGVLYRQMGGFSVILLFGLVAAGAWLVASGTAMCPTFYRRLACVLSLWIALPYLGARTQLISLLGLAVLLFLLSRPETKWQWSIPALFLLWANLHGGFTIGLFLLVLITASTWIVRIISARWPTVLSHVEEPPLFRGAPARTFAILALSAMMTLLNPYGWRLHQEIVESLSNRFMLDTLQEWQFLSLHSGAGRSYAVYLSALSIAMLLWYRRIQPVRWVVLVVFLFLSLKHMRNIPIFLIVSLPLFAELLAEAAGLLVSRVPADTGNRKPWTIAITAATALFLVWLGPEHLNRVVRSGTEPAQYFTETSYPIEAVDWIKTHREQLGSRLYNDYHDGGFLLWWLPGEKIFIDGRMPAWELGDRRIFQDYMSLAAQDPPALSILEKYGVDWALVRRDSLLDRALERQPGWGRAYVDGKVSVYVLRPV